MTSDEAKRRFGRTLRDLRSRQVERMTQRALADELHRRGTRPYTSANVGHWENGASAPPPNVVALIEQILGAVPGELSEMLGYLPPPPPPADSDELRAEIRELKELLGDLLGRIEDLESNQ